MVSEHYYVQRAGQGSADAAHTTLDCGFVQLDHPSALRVLESLPEVLHLGARDPHRSRWMQPTLGLMAEEVARTRPGGESVVTRLADILVIQAIGSRLDDEAATGRAFSRAFRRVVGSSPGSVGRSSRARVDPLSRRTT